MFQPKDTIQLRRNLEFYRDLFEKSKKAGNNSFTNADFGKKLWDDLIHLLENLEDRIKELEKREKNN